MLHEKIDLLMNTLNAGSVDIARLTSSSPTAYSRLRSGSRVPQPGSPTIRRLVQGILLFAKETEQTAKLYTLVECDEHADPEQAVTKWLFSDRNEASGEDEQERMHQFGMRLDRLMQLCGYNNRRLSEDSETEYSYLSRMRRGRRLPQSGSASLRRICDTLYARAEETAQIGAVSELTGIPLTHLNASVLRDWLCGYSDEAGVTVIHRFLGHVGQMTQAAACMPALPQIPAPVIQPFYSGAEGLQQAVIRFLTEVPDGCTLLLYSDDPMDWMSGSFRMVWAALMQKALQRGVRIRIIHNIDRSLPEMVQGIESWMPLYLTGAISPFYSLHPCGERFRHTLFLCPDCAAVTGFTAAGAASGFHYVTDAAALAQFAESFEVLISGCEPLLTVTGELPPPEGVTVRRYGNAQVWADAQSAVVSTLTDPVRSFRFLHPDMCKAFHALLSL